MAYPRFQVSMSKVIFVHELQTLEELSRDLFGFGLGHGRLKIFLEVAVFKKFHGYEHGIRRLEPEVKLDKAMNILSRPR
jgi:hypothetical protein